MEWLTQAIDFFLHVDQHLKDTIQQYGAWTYAILIAIVFCETGLVFTPFLPGDSLLFAAGMFAGDGLLDVNIVFVTLSLAAILGDTVNYWIGKNFGGWLLKRHSRFFKPQYMEKTHAYFERYGGSTIIIARFVPIVRTFAPFVAGMGAMTYRKFILFNVAGGVVWVAACVYCGYFVGSLPWIRGNFKLVILIIIFVSILPGIFEFLRARRAARAVAIAGPAAGAPAES